MFYTVRFKRSGRPQICDLCMKDIVAKAKYVELHLPHLNATDSALCFHRKCAAVLAQRLVREPTDA